MADRSALRLLRRVRAESSTATTNGTEEEMNITAPLYVTGQTPLARLAIIQKTTAFCFQSGRPPTANEYF